MKHQKLLILGLNVLLAMQVRADVIELKNGKTLDGKYAGGTAGTIRFETSEGVQVIETGQVLALTFTGAAAAKPASVAAVPATAAVAAKPAATPVSIPAGTSLIVKMVDTVTSRDPKGKRFTTLLESDVTVNGVVVIKTGTKIYGRVESSKQAGRLAGQSSLDLRLAEVAVGPNLVPVVTSGYTDKGARSVGKAAKGAAAGAAIGAIADDDAAKGAAIGAVASGLKKGETVSVNSGAMLEFKLQQPVSVTTAP